MLHIQCNQCGAWVTVPSGDGIGQLRLCNCCPEEHDHDATANACPGANLNHAGVPCSHPAGGTECLVVTGRGADCPGGHCGVGVIDCTVCRPVTITLMPGSVNIPALVMGN